MRCICSLFAKPNHTTDTYMNSEADFFSHSYRAWRGKKRSSFKILLVPSAPSFQRLELLLKAVIREIRGLNRPPDQRPYSIDQSLMIGALSLAKSLSDLFKEINEDVLGSAYQLSCYRKISSCSEAPRPHAGGASAELTALSISNGLPGHAVASGMRAKEISFWLISFFVDKTNNHAF